MILALYQNQKKKKAETPPINFTAYSFEILLLIKFLLSLSLSLSLTGLDIGVGGRRKGERKLVDKFDSKQQNLLIWREF